ncbi:MAG: hypothetical protein Kow0081_4210 [Candidatus Dojkabacteria bacterium]
MIKPLDIFKTKEVRDLLSDFYYLNFQKAFLGGDIGQKIVQITWDNRNIHSPKEIYRKIASLFEEARARNKYKVEERRPITLFKIAGVKTFLDFGSNKFRTLNEFGYDHPNVKKLIGVDVIPKSGDFAYPEKSEYIQVDEDANNFPLEGESVDLINVQFVFHHVKDKKTIQNIIKNLVKVLKQRGRLLLWEESFEEECDVAKLVSTNIALKIKTDFDLTNRFYLLGPEQRWEFIIVNDWIFNVNNPHMQWSGQYYCWEQWVKIMKDGGLSLEKYYNLGIRVNGQIKHGIHIIGEFVKI